MAVSVVEGIVKAAAAAAIGAPMATTIPDAVGQTARIQRSSCTETPFAADNMSLRSPSTAVTGDRSHQ